MDKNLTQDENIRKFIENIEDSELKNFLSKNLKELFNFGSSLDREKREQLNNDLLSAYLAKNENPED